MSANPEQPGDFELAQPDPALVPEQAPQGPAIPTQGPNGETLPQPPREVDMLLARSVADIIQPQLVGGLQEVGTRAKASLAELLRRSQEFDGRVAEGEQAITEATTAGTERIGQAADAGAEAITARIQTANTEAARQMREVAGQQLAAIDTAGARVEGVIKNSLGQLSDQAQVIVENAEATAEQAAKTAAEAARIADQLQNTSNAVVVEGLRVLVEQRHEPTVKMLGKVEQGKGPHHKHMPLLRATVDAGVPVWLHGEAGSGKSTAARTVAAERGDEFRSRVFGPTASEAALMGYRDAHGEYHTTGFRKIVEHGGVFLIDEIDNANPGIITAMNGVLANGEGEFPDKLIRNHPSARFIAAANTIGKGATAEYVGRTRLDASTLDRFAFLPWNTDWDLTTAIITRSPESSEPPVDPGEGGVPDALEWLDTVMKYHQVIGEVGLRHLITPRAALYGASMAEAGIGRKWLKEMLLFKGMAAEKRAQVSNRLPRS